VGDQLPLVDQARHSRDRCAAGSRDEAKDELLRTAEALVRAMSGGRSSFRPRTKAAIARQPSTSTRSAAKTSRYAAAIGDPDPRLTRRGDVAAPPSSCHSLALRDVPVEKLRPRRPGGRARRPVADRACRRRRQQLRRRRPGCAAGTRSPCARNRGHASTPSRERSGRPDLRRLTTTYTTRTAEQVAQRARRVRQRAEMARRASPGIRSGSATRSPPCSSARRPDAALHVSASTLEIAI